MVLAQHSDSLSHQILAAAAVVLETVSINRLFFSPTIEL